MKTFKKTSVTKLVARFDNELKNLLLSDLQAIRATKDKIVKTMKQREQLSVA